MNTKTAIVTGASGGIGKAIAIALAQEGYELVLLGFRAGDRLECAKNECLKHTTQVHTLMANLSLAEDTKKAMTDAIALLGHVDLLVNCAGISYVGLLTDMTDNDWQTLIDTNLSSVFHTCHAVVPHMVQNKAGRILNISSVWGNTGASCEVAYSASKGGMNLFTKALAKELAPSNITVNALSCGLIDTPMNSCFSAEELDAICEEIPAGRMGTPEEIGKMVCLLACAPTYLTGQIITIDGGWQ